MYSRFELSTDLTTYVQTHDEAMAKMINGTKIAVGSQVAF